MIVCRFIDGGSKLRFLWRASILLLLLNILLFFIHYKDSSLATAKDENEQIYNQEIEVIHRANELIVRHHFTELSAKRLEINWPSASEKRTCYVEEADSCVRLNEEATAFLEGNETAQSISYVIPRKSTGNEEVFLQSVFAEIHQGAPNATVLHIIDEVRDDGMWLTGLPQVGKQTLNLVNYALFSGSGPVSDLYWQQQQYPHDSTDYVTVYGNDAMTVIEPYEQLLLKLKAPRASIVVNEGNQRVIVSDRFIVTSKSKLDYTFQQFAVNQFYMNYAFSSVDQFTAEVLTALLVGDEVDLSLAPNAVSELKNALTTDQITKFIEKIEGKVEKIESSKEVDELIQEVTNYKTSFFQKNSELEEGLYPFLLEIPKEILVEDHNLLENRAIIKDGTTYYPIEDIMTAFGYDVSRNADSLYIESMEKEYRFPLKNQFYVLNDRRFNLQATPFKEVNEEIYFEEAAMLLIFQLNLKSTEDAVQLTPITG